MRRAARVFPLGSSPIIPLRVYIIGYSLDGDAVAILTDPTTLTPEQLNKAVESAMLLDPDQFKDGGPDITHEAKARH